MAEWKKRKWKGYVALVFACVLGILLALNWVGMITKAMHGAFPGLWDGVMQTWRVVVVLYFVYVAQRHLRGQPMVLTVAGRNVGWGRVVLGGWMIFTGVQKRWHPVHSGYEMKPSNATEAASMEATGLYLIPAAGILVLLSGISPLWRKSEEVETAKTSQKGELRPSGRTASGTSQSKSESSPRRHFFSQPCNSSQSENLSIQ